MEISNDIDTGTNIEVQNITIYVQDTLGLLMLGYCIAIWIFNATFNYYMSGIAIPKADLGNSFKYCLH